MSFHQPWRSNNCRGPCRLLRTESALRRARPRPWRATQSAPARLRGERRGRHHLNRELVRLLRLSSDPIARQRSYAVAVMNTTRSARPTGQSDSRQSARTRPHHRRKSGRRNHRVTRAQRTAPIRTSARRTRGRTSAMPAIPSGVWRSEEQQQLAPGPVRAAAHRRSHYLAAGNAAATAALGQRQPRRRQRRYARQQECRCRIRLSPETHSSAIPRAVGPVATGPAPMRWRTSQPVGDESARPRCAVSAQRSELGGHGRDCSWDP